MCECVLVGHEGGGGSGGWEGGRGAGRGVRCNYGWMEEGCTESCYFGNNMIYIISMLLTRF